jgi:hypothetical protein
MISSNNLLRSQSGGATSHSTKLPRNGNQVAGYTASRARSFLAYLLDMSRRSLMKQLAIRLSQQAGKSLVMRGSLYIGLLATVLGGNQ